MRTSLENNKTQLLHQYPGETLDYLMINRTEGY
jgi:hypothetical protein